MNDKEILERIINALDPDYINLCTIKPTNNKGTPYRSIIVNAHSTTYRNEDTRLLFARLKTGGKKNYISFNIEYEHLFTKVGIEYYLIKSEPTFIRIDLDNFISLMDKHAEFSHIMQTIFNDLFTGESFSCCSRYAECSDEKRCTHPDLIYALNCYYKENLIAGKIFYGKNRNF
jgi:hypothetical protein